MEKLRFATNADLVRYSAEHGLLEYVVSAVGSAAPRPD
jgi:hypothetical protein